jgi:RNA polymerase sigma-70 factor (ECF subfamily)
MTTSPGLDRLRPVYEEVHPRLWRAILAWSGSADVADEAVAEAFAQAARRGAALTDPAAWVWRAAFRIAAGEMTRVRREPTVPLGGLDVAQRSGLAVPAEVLDLLRALQQLGDQQRRAVVLTDGAGFPSAEAAALMGTSAATVRVQASRARRRLRHLLADTDATDTDATTPEVDR